MGMGKDQKNEHEFFPKERQGAIYKLILEHGSAKVNDLSKAFSVSDMTIRRDLEELEKRNMVIRTHGGAILRQDKLSDLSYEKRLSQQSLEKRSIAGEAVKLIGLNELIALDASTSSLEVAKQMVDKSSLNIVTNGIKSAEFLVKSELDVVFCGGALRKEALSTVGPIAENNLRKFNFTKAFISGNAIHSTKGLMDTNMYEISMKRLMIAQAKDVIVLADSTKLQKFAFHSVCNLDEINLLITDQMAKKEDIEIFKQKGVEVIIAGDEQDT